MKNELLRKAQALFIEGKHQLSITAFTEYIEVGGEREIGFLSRGVAYLKTKQTDEAIKDFSSVIAINRNNIRAHYYRGITYLVKENYRAAIADFDSTIKLKPDHGGAFFARGTAYARMGNEYEAALNIKTAIQYSEATLQDFAEHYGIFRTQFDKAFAFKRGSGEPPALFLTNTEIDTIRKWLEEDGKLH